MCLFCQNELVSELGLTLAFSVREAGGERFRVSFEFASVLKWVDMVALGKLIDIKLKSYLK